MSAGFEAFEPLTTTGSSRELASTPALQNHQSERVTWEPERGYGRLRTVNRLTKRRTSISLAVVAVVVLAAAWIADRGAGWSPPATSHVVTIRTTPYPEGPQFPAVTRGSSSNADAIFAQLPDPLPKPLPQGRNCQFGNITSLSLDNGEVINYGPCRRPESIDALRCLIIGDKPNCA